MMMNHWMFNCKKVNQMVSDSLDRKLPFFQRMGIRFHLKMCKFCSRYLSQLKIIQELLHLHEQDVETRFSITPLSEESKNRIKKLMAEDSKA